MSKIPFEAELWETPPDYDYPNAIDVAQRLAADYAVIFVRFNEAIGKMELLGSGTLVTQCGVKGILTADHVPEIGIYRNHRTEFSICYTAAGGSRPYNLVRTDQFMPVVVGKYSEEHEEEGPDLTFRRIVDPELSNSLGRVKSFHCLDDEIDISNYPIAKMPWTISGSPNSFTRYEKMEDGMELMRWSDFHAPAYFSALEQRDGFDYLKLRVNTGTEGPEEYGGVSGGGIWLIAAIERGTARAPVPILQGVCYYATTPQNGSAILTGHGPNSIYKRLREKILASLSQEKDRPGE